MLKREEKITLRLRGKDKYEVENRKGKVFDSNDDYYIYFKNVNFKNNGVIEGRFLGNTGDKIIDDFCSKVLYDGKSFTTNGKEIKTARMVAVDNKKKTIIIIHN
ncbi:hypothetical protein PQE75_gp035 [Bacillus phage vB_BcoS-136]|uniref:Uncharacterized protein n=1 Tax=Bacillus phage vB_BcoS-136 TaxID=2419619 RepID=A0A3G3BVA2_9CAUD|nr:hypothetical protein PQE75_gp035 [Bacillus phage vB_BcoS-136]AYP68167.1 hypothetical protein vBBcoS136_00035 [Bacillus phage vB_BcoS-136]